MPTQTPNHSFDKPDDGETDWGTFLNSDLDDLDTILKHFASDGSALGSSASPIPAVHTEVLNNIEYPTTASEITTAISDLKTAGGGTLVLPQDLSGLDVSSETPYLIDFEPLLVVGRGEDVTTLDGGTTDQPVIKVDGGTGGLTNVHLRDMRLKRSVTGATTDILECYEWHGDMQNVGAKTGDRNGALFEDCYDASVMRCDFSGDQYGIHIKEQDHGCNAFALVDSEIQGSGVAGSIGVKFDARAASSDDTQGIWFIRNKIMDWGSNGMDLRGPRGVALIANRFETNGANDVRLRNGGAGTDPWAFIARDNVHVNDDTASYAYQIDLLENPDVGSGSDLATNFVNGAIIEGYDVRNYGSGVLTLNDSSTPVYGVRFGPGTVVGVGSSIDGLVGGAGADDHLSLSREDINGQAIESGDLPMASNLPDGTVVYHRGYEAPIGVTGSTWRAIGRVFGSYTGDGSTSKAISLDINPRWVVVQESSGTVGHIGPNGFDGNGMGGTGSLTSSGFTVGDASSDADPNTNGETYHYRAW